MKRPSHALLGKGPAWKVSRPLHLKFTISEFVTLTMKLYSFSLNLLNSRKANKLFQVQAHFMRFSQNPLQIRKYHIKVEPQFMIRTNHSSLVTNLHLVTFRNMILVV